MKRRLAAAALALLLTFSLTACGGENTPPEIKGVQDQTVQAGTEFDALSGVSVEDAQEGDLTAKLVIDATPSIDFTGGKAVIEQAGEYELVYTVTDKGGLTAESYATLTVTRQTGDAAVYKQFDFSAPQTVDDHGWTAQISGGADASGELKQGAYVFDIKTPGGNDADIQLVKSGLPLKAAEYRIAAYAKATQETSATIQAGGQNAEVTIGTGIAPLELDFTSTGAGSTDVILNLGQSPAGNIITIDKIEIFEISGKETKTPVYTGGPELTVTAGDGASAQANGGTVEISGYPTDGGVWSIKTDIGLPGVSIEAGEKYYYSFSLKAQNAQSGECLVESASQADANRVNFNSFAAGAGETVTVTSTFTAEQAVADPVIRLQIGAPSDGVTSNQIQISDVQFGTVSGDLKTVKTIDAFTPFGRTTANAENPDQPWETFNGTDEGAEGVGTIWTENGKFFYRIDQGGVTDWHNKLICGYSGNPLTLEGDSYYTVEITVKADKNVSCGFFLNTLGGWDPRISETLDITTQEQTFSFTTTDTFITDMDFEMLFQFGSEQTAQLGEVTIELSNVTIYQMPVM